MKHWVFDLDGTLVDSFERYFEALEAIFAGFGKRFTPELRHPALTQPLDRFFEAHLGAGSVAAAFADLQKSSNADAARIVPFAGIVDTLQGLRARGSSVSVWTNRDLESASLILEHSGLSRYSARIVSGTCVERRKPDPQGLERIIAELGCEPGEVTMVGDHEHDVEAAKQVGARAVRASWHSYWPVEPCPRADRQFFKVDDFSAWALSG